ARLLTGTGLEDSFPPLELRLATTRGTNALLERKGAKVVLFTTWGFRDLPLIRDQRRSDLFALEHTRPHPLHEASIEVEERLDAEGHVLTKLCLDETLQSKVQEQLAQGHRIAAVALMHAYRNPEHETVLRDYLLEQGFDHVSISSDLAPLIKLLPRMETAITNAYLHPVMQSFLDHVGDRIGVEQLILTMTSAGGLEPIAQFAPKDSLLSGPAGGVSGAAAVAEAAGYPRILTFDMGGTSTDVARYDHGFQYQFEQVVGDAHLLSPSLKIETVASGGGSICDWQDGGLKVGPESAGAAPGPACYGKGGPLTVTDVNLLLRRIDPDNFGIPLSDENLTAAKSAALRLQKKAGLPPDKLDEGFLRGLIEIAVEQMADAIRTISIRDGADPAHYALLAFGGAGPLHACEIADRLQIETILVPAEAGLLSAYGLSQASIERFAERQLNLKADDTNLAKHFDSVDQEALKALESAGFKGCISRRLAEVRLQGQDATLTLEVENPDAIFTAFAARFESIFGYAPSASRTLEVVSYRAIAGTGRKNGPEQGTKLPTAPPLADTDEFIDRAHLSPDSTVAGPVVIQDPFSTLYLKRGWQAAASPDGTLILSKSTKAVAEDASRPEQIERELFRHRFDNIVAEMGTLLQRSAISTNVKERADFSCALLDGDGTLITSAPHIPVHLGALGACVRQVAETLPMKPGDTVITNHPGFGGSHLPDVTLITPVFVDAEESPIAYVANRAHHAEIGGITPGSMPPGATRLAEEGVVIAPTLLLKGGESRFSEIEAILTQAPFPTRNLNDNLADLNAQLAANRRGQKMIKSLIEQHHSKVVREQMNHLKDRSSEALSDHLASSGFEEGAACECLDDGSKIQVHVATIDSRLKVDFTGTSGVHPQNFNATPAIVQSALLYVLRLWTQSEVPLNEGMLRSVEIELPRCFLNPDFVDDPTQCPAVVGGNVETSQRLVDTLLKALEVQACSQGTMNNFIFGDDEFGYYETICGGAGAGDGYPGASGIHTHMTNTAITDPEILEQRYPVRLHQFSLRSDSGGRGTWRGGDGVLREIEFLKPLHLSLLTQHRELAPYGLRGGENGATGKQFLNGEPLPGVISKKVSKGDRLLIATPGGGGYGKDLNLGT
ncbi:MAG: hydantoinase B/oxoprolinase family protein, partial [Verrucomicrobiota bacterium]